MLKYEGVRYLPPEDYTQNYLRSSVFFMTSPQIKVEYDQLCRLNYQFKFTSKYMV